MADKDDEPGSMSVVPYQRLSDSQQQLVLRHGNAIVLYDKDSQQLSVTEPPQPHTANLVEECPTCGRPFETEIPQNGRGRSSTGLTVPALPQQGFIDQGYFRMLAASRRNSPSQSRAASPRRGLLQSALKIGKSRKVSSGPTIQDVPDISENTKQRTESISKSAFSPGFYKQFFVEKRELGRGGYGVVTLVEHKLAGTSLGEFACKRIPVGDDTRWLEKVLVEVKLLQGIPHRNLVTCHWVWLEDHQSSAFAPKIPCLWMLQEYCNLGDLQIYVTGPKETRSQAEMLKQRLRRRSRGDSDAVDGPRKPSRMPFEDIYSFFKDITSGLNHLHSKGFIHRDLKPANCLIHQDGNKRRVLISDFGEVQATSSRRRATGATGTISYCAPEVLRRDGPDHMLGDFTTKSDIFSLGMIVYFMCFARLPYQNADDMDEDDEDLDELRAEIEQWTGFSDDSQTRLDLPDQLYRYLRRLLSLSPVERPSTEEILTSIRIGISVADPVFDAPDFGGARSTSPEKFNATSIPARRATGISPIPVLSTTIYTEATAGQRSLSPQKESGRDERIGTINSDHSPHVTLDRIKREQLISNSSAISSGPPQSPRLLLPAPRDTISLTARLRTICASLVTLSTFRIALFMVKMATLFVPCTPYAPVSYVLYPLLGLALLDVGLLNYEFSRSVMLLGIHLTLISFVFQRGQLCEMKQIVWDAM